MPKERKAENLTADDAMDRVSRARVGSLLNASTSYILALRVRLLGWIEELDAELRYRDYEARLSLDRKCLKDQEH